MNDDKEPGFAELIGDLKRYHHDRVNPYTSTTGGKPITPTRDRDQEPHSLYHTGEIPSAGNSHFNAGLQKKLQRRIRTGVIPVEARLDLHGCRQTEAVAMLESFFERASGARMRLVIVIHGQGHRSQDGAVLKPLVQGWLSTRSSVLGWCPAQSRDGGAGASYVYLRD